jgi:hypothetical protein
VNKTKEIIVELVVHCSPDRWEERLEAACDGAPTSESFNNQGILGQTFCRNSDYWKNMDNLPAGLTHTATKRQPHPNF